MYVFSPAFFIPHTYWRINVAGMSREIGISPTLMRQYAIGQRKPSKQRKEMIVKGIKSLAKKMEAASVY